MPLSFKLCLQDEPSQLISIAKLFLNLWPFHLSTRPILSFILLLLRLFIRFLAHLSNCFMSSHHFIILTSLLLFLSFPKFFLLLSPLSSLYPLSRFCRLFVNFVYLVLTLFTISLVSLPPNFQNFIMAHFSLLFS